MNLRRGWKQARRVAARSPVAATPLRTGGMARRALAALAALGLLLTIAAAPVEAAVAHCGAGESPQFRFDLAFLKSQIGDIMGEPLECEHGNPDNGDTLQQTTTGLAFYRQHTSTPTFTNGWDHWAWTASGLVYWVGNSIDPPGVFVPSATSLLFTRTSSGSPTSLVNSITDPCPN